MHVDRRRHGSGGTLVEQHAGNGRVRRLISPFRMASAASESLMALAGRFFGSLASMDIRSARTGFGRVSGRGGGASFTCARAMAIWDSPENGRWPVRHS